MKQRKPSTARPKPAFKRRRVAPFSPPEPAIVTGKFKGQKLSELSNEDLTFFMRWEARSQTGTTISFANLFAPNQIAYPDLSQYWFAKFELERRKEPAERRSGNPIKLTADDTEETIALRLLDLGLRAASRSNHPDAGGDTRIMQRLAAARDYAKARLKQQVRRV